MNIEEFVGKMKSIQSSLLEFLDDESDAEEKYEKFVKLITTQQIINEKHEFKALLQLINQISDSHHRVHNFISKIERLLEYFKKDIQKYFLNSEIFNIFKNNKRILLFLMEEKIMTIDEYIFSQIMRDEYNKLNYPEYFFPEIKPFLTKEIIEKYSSKNSKIKNEELIYQIKNEIDNDFYEKRREGENDDYICKLIRNNEIKEFIAFVNQANLPLDSFIKKSIFETNPLLIDSEEITRLIYKYDIKLIEYASFYGSIDIIKYMHLNGAELTSNMWYYTVHSRNAELIKYLEENHVPAPYDDFNPILSESIKCHHNETSIYIIENLIKEEDLQNDIKNKYFINLYRFAVKFFNYCFFPENMKYKNMFFYLCEFDYYILVKLYLEERNIDVNARDIKTFNYSNDI